MVGRRHLGSGVTDGRLWRCQNARLSHVLVSCQTPPTDRFHPGLITRYVCNCPTMNSPSCTDGLGHVYSLEWFSKSWSATDAVLIRQWCALCWMTPRPLGLPTPLTLRVDLPFSHQWTYSGYRLDSQLARRSPASGYAYHRLSLNNCRSSVQLFIALKPLGHC